MHDCTPRSTPCEQKVNYTEDTALSDVATYREAVGSLIYLTICARPDLSFVVSKFSQYFARPTEQQWSTMKHVLRYLKGRAWVYRRVDWAADEDRRSTTGYCVSLKQGWGSSVMENKKAAYCCTIHL